MLLSAGMCYERVANGSLSWASSATSSPSWSLMSVSHTTLFATSKGKEKRHAQDASEVLGMIAEPTGTDGHRPRSHQC